ncbi:MAG TPA: SseB family protein, partial [Microlunatus sp.]|nr:SseB family protein [Microlunatus sp.]
SHLPPDRPLSCRALPGPVGARPASRVPGAAPLRAGTWALRDARGPSPFPGDDGAPRAAVREALGRFAATYEPADYLRAVAALCGDRLLVPVVATATQVGTTVGGLSSDKEAEMAVVLLQRADGGRAMLGFTGLDALQAWDARARPVPVTVDKVAETATAEGAVAVLVDVAGPHPLVLEGEVLDALARGHRLVDLADGFGWAMPAADRDDTAE